MRSSAGDRHRLRDFRHILIRNLTQTFTVKCTCSGGTHFTPSQFRASLSCNRRTALDRFV